MLVQRLGFQKLWQNMISRRIYESDLFNFFKTMGRFGQVDIEVVFVVRNVKEKLQIIPISICKLLYIQQIANGWPYASFLNHLSFYASNKRFAFVEPPAWQTPIAIITLQMIFIWLEFYAQ